MSGWGLHSLEVDAVSCKGKISLQRWSDAWDKEMDWYGKRHPVFERMRCDGNVTQLCIQSWLSKPRTRSWESKAYTKYVAYIHKNCTRKVCWYITSDEWQRGKKILLNKWITRLQDFELHLTPIWACVSAITKVAEKMDRMENNQQDTIDELSTVLYSDGTDKPMVVWDTPDGEQDSQNSQLQRLIKFFSS